MVRPVGDQAREDIQPSGRAFRIRHGADIALQRKAFLQLDDIDTAALEHGTAVKVDLVHGKPCQLVLDPHVSPRKERGLYPPGTASKPQIKAGRYVG